MAVTPLRPPGVPLSIDTVLSTLPDAPFITSRDRDWGGLTVDVFGTTPHLAMRTPPRDHHVMVYCTSGSAELTQTRVGMTHQSRISAGTSLILPAECDGTWEGHLAASIRMRLPISLLDLAAEQAGGQRPIPFEMRNMFSVRDHMLERIALILMSELERASHPAQKLIADTMSCALAAHLLRSHNMHETPVAVPAHALGVWQLAKLTEYIEENLESPIGLQELASIARISKFHFARVFKRSTGMTAIHYVEQRRIQRAKALIMQTDAPLAEVALQTGFADQSHFTRRFRHQAGCTPGTFARECGRGRRTMG